MWASPQAAIEKKTQSYTLLYILIQFVPIALIVDGPFSYEIMAVLPKAIACVMPFAYDFTREWVLQGWMG